jgi:hypothetical protein
MEGNMGESERQYVRIAATHKDCSIIKVKEKLGGAVGKLELLNPAVVALGISQPMAFGPVFDWLRTNRYPIVDIDEARYRVLVHVEDEVISAVTATSRPEDSPWVIDYDVLLQNDYRFFKTSCESFTLAVKDVTDFRQRVLPAVARASGPETTHYGIYSDKPLDVRVLSLRSQYVLRFGLKNGYLANRKSSVFGLLAEEFVSSGTYPDATPDVLEKTFLDAILMLASEGASILQSPSPGPVCGVGE